MRYSVHTRHNVKDEADRSQCELEVYEPQGDSRRLAAFVIGRSCKGLRIDDSDDSINHGSRYTESTSGVVYSRVGRILEEFIDEHDVTSSRSAMTPDSTPESDYYHLVDPDVVDAETVGLLEELATTSLGGSS